MGSDFNLVLELAELGLERVPLQKRESYEEALRVTKLHLELRSLNAKRGGRYSGHLSKKYWESFREQRQYLIEWVSGGPAPLTLVGESAICYFLDCSPNTIQQYMARGRGCISRKDEHGDFTVTRLDVK